MKIKFIALLMLLLGTSEAIMAQQNDIPKTSHYIDGAVGIGSGTFSSAISWYRTHGIIKSNKLRLGYGARFSYFGADNLNYTSAPADLAAETGKIDTLNVATSSIMALNAGVHIQYLITPKLLVGFNIDAIGLGWGAEVTGKFSANSENHSFDEKQAAQPTGLNVLLVGDNDIGQLKSEFYVAYALTPSSFLRAGFDYTFSEYTTDKKLTFDNNRFRGKGYMFFVAYSFNPFKQKQ